MNPRIHESTTSSPPSASSSRSISVIGICYERRGPLTRAHSIHAATHPPPPALTSALKSYNAHLLSLQAGLRTREQAAEKTLQQYERAGGKGMLEIAGRYAQLTEEIERVKDEIARLEWK